MSVEVLKQLQTDLKTLGFYTGDVDGKWGSGSHGAFLKARAQARAALKPPAGFSPLLFNYSKAVAWSNKVSTVFVDRIVWTVGALDMPLSGADDLMSCIAWESAETFSAGIVNKAGSGATGLIQFMPGTAIVYFYTADQIKNMNDDQRKAAGRDACARLAKMTDEDQINYVYKYFQPYKGRLKNLGDLYMAILWPAGVGKDDSYVLWNQATKPETYRQNAGLDINKDGVITRAECLVKINEKLVKGLHPDNLKV